MADDPDLTPNLIAGRAASRPNAVLLQEVGGSTLTYKQFHELSLRWASLLEGLGVTENDRVVSMVGGAASYWSWIGTAWLGALHIPVDVELRGERLRHVMDVTQARVLVIERTCLPRILADPSVLAPVQRVLVIDGVPDGPTGRLPFDLCDAGALLARTEPAPRPPVGPDQVQACLFTSGTTGRPKCVIRSWETFESSGRWLFPDDTHPPDHAAGGGYYNPWPPFHSLALSGLAVAVQRGLRLVVRRGFSLSGFWPDIRGYDCTHAVVLIVAPLILGVEPGPDDRDNPLERVTMVPLAGNFSEFEKRFDVRVGTMYGQSETGPLLATAAPGDFRIVGTPVPGIEAELIGPDGTPVEAGQTGELLVRRPGAAQPFGTYLSAPGDTPDPPPADGWFRTGDAFRRTDSGEYQLVDRVKDYIRHRGHNLSSMELEHELLGHPSVAECAFVGVRSDLADAEVVGDEDVKAVVVLEDGAAMTPLEVVDFLRPKVPGYMLPRYVEFVDALPRTATLKVRKDELRGGTRGTDVWRLDPR